MLFLSDGLGHKYLFAIISDHTEEYIKVCVLRVSLIVIFSLDSLKLLI